MAQTEDLVAEVSALLSARRGDWQRIAADQASGVSYSWLSKFANGHIENPGYLTLRTLRDYLLGKSEPAEASNG